MSSPDAKLEQIYNFRRIGERLGTAGQPTEAQFHDIQEAGFQAVINLALPTSDNAIAHEGSIVTKLGMAYFHIPVNFQRPTSQDYQTFRGVMNALGGRRVFVHCAANMRVSAFLYLYRILEQGVPTAEAEADLRALWEPDEAWANFLREQLKSKQA